MAVAPRNTDPLSCGWVVYLRGLASLVTGVGITWSIRFCLLGPFEGISPDSYQVLGECIAPAVVSIGQCIRAPPKTLD